MLKMRSWTRPRRIRSRLAARRARTMREARYKKSCRPRPQHIVPAPEDRYFQGIDLDHQEGKGEKHEPQGDQKPVSNVFECHHRRGRWFRGYTFSTGLAEQTGWPENQNQHQQGEGKDIFIIAGDVSGGKGFGETEDKTAQHRAGNGADAAQHCGVKALMPAMNPM
jgi:hypothetical protein